MSIFEHYQMRYEKAKEEEYSLQEFLNLCKEDKGGSSPWARGTPRRH